MQTKQIERTLTLELKRRFDEALVRKYERIYVLRRPAQSSKIISEWNRTNRPPSVTRSLTPPLQPEMDMILCKGDEMDAIEIKYFEIRGSSLTRSFYEGIEQSLALLRWGFDHVALWQLFEESVSPEELWFYGGWTWNFLHGSSRQCGLDLPIDFTFLRVQKRGERHDFYPIQPISDNGGIRLERLPPPYGSEFHMEFRHRNPLREHCPEALRLRRILVEWLSKRIS